MTEPAAYRLELPLPPVGKGRGRAVRTPAGVRIVTPTKTRRWEADLAQLAADVLPRAPLEGPVRVDILAVLPRPKRLLRRRDPDGLVWAPVKPDGDNVRKAVLDALKRHWRDDSQVVAGETLKVFSEKDGLPRTIVRVALVPDRSHAVWLAAHGVGLLDGPQEDV